MLKPYLFVEHMNKFLLKNACMKGVRVVKIIESSDYWNQAGYTNLVWQALAILVTYLNSGTRVFVEFRSVFEFEHLIEL